MTEGPDLTPAGIEARRLAQEAGGEKRTLGCWLLLAGIIAFPVAFIALIVTGHFLWGFGLLFVGVFAVGLVKASEDAKAKKPALRPSLVCPHCGVKGRVEVAKVTRKKGVSGGKATGAVLTGGVSVVATGLSRKEGAQACHCLACGMRWDVA